MNYPTDAAFNPTEPSFQQTADWTCSAMSLSWLNRSMGINRGRDEWSAVELIGNPEHINHSYGLMDGSGGRLAQLLREDRGAAWTAWLGWSDVYRMVEDHAVLLGGAGWYHWVAVRETYNGVLRIANSADGWMGVGQELSEEQFLALGPFACVLVPLHISFPPPPET